MNARVLAVLSFAVLLSVGCGHMGKRDACMDGPVAATEAAIVPSDAGVVFGEAGRATQVIEASLPQVYNATLAALKEMDLPLQATELGTFGARIESEYPDGARVWIDMFSGLDSGETEVKILVEPGNLKKAVDILTATHARLEQ